MMLTNAVHRWDDLKKLKNGEMILPRFVDFHTSNFCNMHCIGCQYDGRLDTKYMAENDHFDVVDKFLKIGVKAFDFCGGGEPLYPPYMDRLLRHIKTHGSWSGLLSNGSIMTDSIVSAIVDCCAYIRVSLESSNEEDFTKYKRVPSYMWNKVLGNVRRLQRLKRNSNSDLEVSIKFAVSKSLRGEKHYADAIMLGQNLDAKRITFRAIRDSDEELNSSDKSRENMILENEISKWPKSIRDRISYWIVPIQLESVPQCWLNPLHTVVHYNGDVHVCCYGYYRPDQLYLGNIIRQSFDDIWLSQRHWDVIKGIKREDCARVDCKFFQHHQAIEEMGTRELIEWL